MPRKRKNPDADARIAAYEAKMKSLVDEGKYQEAIEYSEANGSVLYECDADTCTFYSFKIIGVCRSKDIRKGWEEGGYRPPHWIEAGNALFDAGKYEEAIESYYKRIQENPDDDRAWYLMGCAYRAIGNPYESVEAWDKAFSIVMKDENVDTLEADPDSAASWAERGDIEYNQENWKEAIVAYRNSLSICADQPDIWFRKGCAHYEMEEYEDALIAFENTLKKNPHDLCAANNKGVTLFKLRRFEEAKETFRSIACRGMKDDLNEMCIQRNKERIESPEKAIESLIFISNEAPTPNR
ncbi:MAG: lipoprotein NlpI [Methanoregulaceae archaeon PtaB.Bin108]|nr:MAG: lipoprotein NlpI [Methanoregulaceae archaeon PtaB.Bin108]